MLAMANESGGSSGLDLRTVPNGWAHVDQLRRRAWEIAGASPDSSSSNEASADAALPGGHRLHHAVPSYLMDALDCHDALPKLLDTYGASRMAMWALLRAQFESSFYALWLLDPPEGEKRVARAVQGEWLDSILVAKGDADLLTPAVLDRHDAETRSEIQADLDRRRAAKAAAELDYRQELQSLGCRVVDEPREVNVVDGLISLQIAKDRARRAGLITTWRLLASRQHGNVGSLVRLSDGEVLEEVPGGQRIMLRPSGPHFRFIASTASYLTGAALRRFIDWHTPRRGTQVGGADGSAR